MKCESQEFPRNLGFSPIRMLLPDSGAGKLPGEQAHVPGQQKPLLPGHIPQCFFLIAFASGVVSDITTA